MTLVGYGGHRDGVRSTPISVLTLESVASCSTVCADSLICIFQFDAPLQLPKKKGTYFVGADAKKAEEMNCKKPKIKPAGRDPRIPVDGLFAWYVCEFRAQFTRPELYHRNVE